MLSLFLLIPWLMLFEHAGDLDLFLDFGRFKLLPSQLALGACAAVAFSSLFFTARVRGLGTFILVVASIALSWGVCLFNSRYQSGPVTTASFQVLAFLILLPALRTRLTEHRSFERLIRNTKVFLYFNVVLILLSYLFPSVGVFGETSGDGLTRRAFGLLGDQVAWILVIAILAALGARRRLFAFGLFGVLSLTGSIGAFLLLIGEWCLLFLGQSRHRPGRFVAAAFIVIIMAIGFILSGSRFGFGPLERLSSGDLFSPGAVGYHRMLAFENALEVIPENPVFGLGIGGYSTEMNSRWESYILQHQSETLTVFTSTHNQFLQIAAETGIVGLLALVLFTLSLVRLRSQVLSTRRLAPWPEALVRWSTSLLLFNQSSVWIIPGSFLLYFALVGWAILYSTTYSPGRG